MIPERKGILTATILVCISTLECRTFMPLDVNFGKRVVHGIIDVLTDVDLDNCRIECVRRLRCQSINYAVSLLLCELNFLSSTACVDCLENNHKYVTSEKSQFNAMIHSSSVCDPSSCSVGEICMLGANEQVSCHTSDCDFYIADHPAYVPSSPIGIYSKTSIFCPIGYVSRGKSYVGCSKTGQWTQTDHKCPLVDCGLPPEVPNASTTIISNTTYSDNVTVVCDEKYIDTTISEDILMCRENGSWDTPSINCEWGGCMDVYSVQFQECVEVIDNTGNYIRDYSNIVANKTDRKATKVKLGVWCKSSRIWEHAPVTCADTLLCDAIPNVISGYYAVYSSSLTTLIYCNTNTLDGTWTVIQRRLLNWVHFDQTWENYKNGFGYVNGDYWIGNDIIHEMTAYGDCRVAFVMTDQDGDEKYAVYETFVVGPESDHYRLNIGGYTVVNDDAGDSMANGVKFSTKDMDNDDHSFVHCANLYSGGWWWKNCGKANLNGNWESTIYKQGLFWDTWHGSSYSMSNTMIMIQRKSTPPLFK